MAEEKIVYVDKNAEIKKLIDAVPVELLRKGPTRYAPMDQQTKGSWRVILEDFQPVALAWTDWEKGFDIITMIPGEVSDRLDNYVITAKSLDIPAGWAYTTLDRFVKRFRDSDVSLAGQRSGKLSSALIDASTYDPDAERPKPEYDEELTEDED